MHIMECKTICLNKTLILVPDEQVVERNHGRIPTSQ